MLGQSLEYAPERGTSFRYHTTNRLRVSQRVLGAENHYTLRTSGIVRLTLMNPGPRMLWRLGFDDLDLEIEGSFPTPRREELRGAVVTLTTSPSGVALDARAAGVVPPGLGVQVLERAAAAFFPRLPQGRQGLGWSDTLTVTEVLQGVTTEVQTVVEYAVAETSALAGRPVVPVEYEGRIEVRGMGTLGGSRVSLEGGGRVSGHYLYNPEDGIFDLHEQRQVLESTLSLEDPEWGEVEIPSRQVMETRSERLF